MKNYKSIIAVLIPTLVFLFTACSNKKELENSITNETLSTTTGEAVTTNEIAIITETHIVIEPPKISKQYTEIPGKVLKDGDIINAEKLCIKGKNTGLLDDRFITV
jgi:hypothetical protein